MADLPVVKLPIDTSDFDEFLSLYKKFQDSVKALPGAWGKVSEEISGTEGIFIGMTAALIAAADASKKIADNHTKINQTATKTGRVFHDMARDTKDVAKNILNATASLLKWTALTSVFSGLVGAGGLFGIDRLAISAGSARRG